LLAAHSGALLNLRCVTGITLRRDRYHGRFQAWCNREGAIEVVYDILTGLENGDVVFVMACDDVKQSNP
jgi:hypothetical protein